MNRLLLGNTWQDNSRTDILPPFDTKVQKVQIMCLMITQWHFSSAPLTQCFRVDTLASRPHIISNSDPAMRIRFKHLL